MALKIGDKVKVKGKTNRVGIIIGIAIKSEEYIDKAGILRKPIERGEFIVEFPSNNHEPPSYFYENQLEKVE